MLIRCSSLDDLMSNAKKQGELSAKAKEVIIKMAIESHFDTHIYSSNKYIKKGIECENDSIELFNTVFFKALEKNTVRISNDFITGECDLIDDDLIIDIKTSWDIKTFGMQRIDPTMYEWQLRGYMWLYDKPKACTVHCLVNTPPHLIRFDDGIHEFDHIPPSKRVIVGNIVYRDIELEKAMIEKITLAREYYDELLQAFNVKNELP